jgi:hypothetical protein
MILSKHLIVSGLEFSSVFFVNTLAIIKSHHAHILEMPKQKPIRAYRGACHNYLSRTQPLNYEKEKKKHSTAKKNRFVSMYL